MLVSDIIGDVSFEANDLDNTRWSADRKLRYYNQALLQVAMVKPNAVSTITTMKLTSDTTKQQLPDDGFQLLKLIRNMGSDGLTPGAPVDMADMDSINSLTPTWHTARGTEIINYFYDKKFNETFYVYPGPQSGTDVYIELAYAARPATAVSAAATFALDDIYSNAVANYMLHRLYRLELDSPASASRAAQYLTLFAQDLGLKLTAEEQYKPD